MLSSSIQSFDGDNHFLSPCRLALSSSSSSSSSSFTWLVDFYHTPALFVAHHSTLLCSLFPLWKLSLTNGGRLLFQRSSLIPSSSSSSSHEEEADEEEDLMGTGRVRGFSWSRVIAIVSCDTLFPLVHLHLRVWTPSLSSSSSLRLALEVRCQWSGNNDQPLQCCAIFAGGALCHAPTREECTARSKWRKWMKGLDSFQGFARLCLYDEVRAEEALEAVVMPAHPSDVVDDVIRPFDAPFHDLDQMLDEPPTPKRTVHRLRRRRPLDDAKLLHCHDMAGGYKDDQFWQRTLVGHSYHFMHWALVDVFVYFSHYCIAPPPLMWINAAHKEGCLCLGTFITEWEHGEKMNRQLLLAPKLYARRLAQLALSRGFDGWLINIEADVQTEHVQALSVFLRELTRLCREWLENSLVLMYDSVVESTGKVRWQSVLNEENWVWFNACDGLFTDYHWQAHHPAQSASLAGQRQLDIYTGIDVFGRGTFGGGQWQCADALKIISEARTSIALFAPAWTFESCGVKHDAELWRALDRKFWYGDQVITVELTKFPKPDTTNVDSAVVWSEWDCEAGGDGWQIAYEEELNGFCLISSFKKCSRTVVVDLHEYFTASMLKQAVLQIEQRYKGTGPNFQDMYSLHLRLEDNTHNVIETFDMVTTSSEYWQSLRHNFAPSCARFLSWSESAQDCEGWSGHYGTRIASGWLRIEDATCRASCINDYIGSRALSFQAALPIRQNFDCGSGYNFWLEGKVTSVSLFDAKPEACCRSSVNLANPNSWFDLSLQSPRCILAPEVQRSCIFRYSDNVTVHYSQDYNQGFEGGCSLRLDVTHLISPASIQCPLMVFDHAAGQGLTLPVYIRMVTKSKSFACSLVIQTVAGQVTTEITSTRQLDDGWAEEACALRCPTNTVTAINAVLTAKDDEAEFNNSRLVSAWYGLITISAVEHVSEECLLPVTCLRAITFHHSSAPYIQITWQPHAASHLVNSYEVRIDGQSQGYTNQTFFVLSSFPVEYTCFSSQMHIFVRCRYINGRCQDWHDAASLVHKLWSS